MNIQEVFEKLKGKFGEAVELQDNPLTPFIKVRSDIIQQVAEMLKSTPVIPTL